MKCRFVNRNSSKNIFDITETILRVEHQSGLLRFELHSRLCCLVHLNLGLDWTFLPLTSSFWSTWDSQLNSRNFSWETSSTFLKVDRWRCLSLSKACLSSQVCVCVFMALRFCKSISFSISLPRFKRSENRGLRSFFQSKISLMKTWFTLNNWFFNQIIFY